MIVIPNNCLYKARRNTWMILPNTNTPQEVTYKPFSMSRKSFRVIKVLQKDTSRLHMLPINSNTLQKVKNKIDADLEIDSQLILARDLPIPQLLTLMQNISIEDLRNQQFQYVGWHINTFLNGKRIIPLLIDNVNTVTSFASKQSQGLIEEDIIVKYPT